MEAIETVPASLMLCDRDDRIVFCNSATQRYFPTASHLLIPGTKYEDLLREHAATFVEGIGDNFKAWIAERMEKHRSGNTNLVRTYKDGRWAQIIERRTSEGGIISVRVDITELKKHEKEYEAAQVRLKDAIETMPASFVLYDHEEKILLRNDQAEKFFPEIADLLVPGTKIEDLTRTRYRRIHPDASETEIERAVQKRLQQFRNPGVIPPDQLPDGRWTQAIERHTADGGTVCVRIDITELKKREVELETLGDTLRKSQEYVAQAQRLARMVSDFRDLRSDTAEWSDMSYEIFGVDKTTFVPTTENFLKMVLPEDHAVVARTRGEIAAGKNPEPCEYRVIRPDGAIRHIARECAVEFDASGKPLYMIGTIRDVTEQHAKDEEIQQKGREIEERNQELQRSNAELEQFAYVASHDLQEPLRMVASYCQLLQRRYNEKLDKDANEFIGFAVEGANRMQRLINDLLSYSRIGRKGGDPAPFEFAEAVTGALANLKAAISDSGATVNVGTLPRVVGVCMQLTQLMQNLIGNAIKFQREGVTPTITISATAEGAMSHIVVEDNGIGIESQYLERVFLIFQRLHERNKYPGTGIGLAIVKKVIEYHGGRIWIESTPGQGSRFHFTLPADIRNGAAND